MEDIPAIPQIHAHSLAMRSFFICLLLLLLSLRLLAQGQKLTISNRRAIESYQQALAAYERYDYDNAVKYLNESLDREPQFVEAYLMLTQVESEQGHVDRAIAAAEKAIGINPDFFPRVYYNLGNLYLYKGEYSRALTHYTKYLDTKNLKPESIASANRKIANCRFALNALENPVEFNPVNLGDSINTELDEYWPSLSADESTLVITTSLPREVTEGFGNSKFQEDFYLSRRNADGVWGLAKPVGKPLNTPFNEGAQSLTSDGKRMYYTVCRGVCNIFTSELKPDGTWSNPVKLPPAINSERYSEKQPSIAPDGQTLYFVSNRPGGFGRYDIWRSQRRDDGSWGAAENLGDSINTDLDEQSPFIHFDNQTLYFASDGHTGMGGLDIFVSHQLENGKWSKPVNLGYPINTFKNEDGLIVNTRGTVAYYSSERNAATGRDIYSFTLNDPVRPTPASYMVGTIADAESRSPLTAKFSLVDLASEKELMKSVSDDRGQFLVCIPTNHRYAFFASHPGYLFYSEHFDLQGVHSIDKPYRKDILLKPIKVNEVLVMRNIFFATDSYELKPESRVELNRLVEMLTHNSSIRIEVSGHTDNVGSDTYNLKLSAQRAKSVADYLVSRNISSDRVKWVGLGESQPMSSNQTAEGRAENRRTEVKVIGM
jgi:outer membrane protein OmpA-like peptidoglycan-associated protein